MFRLVKTAVHRLVSLALPPTCMACKGVIATDSGLGICATCWPKLPRWNTADEPMPTLPKYVDSFAAPFLYQPPIAEFIPALKFADATEFAAPLAHFMLPLLPKNADLCLPIPLHTSRLQRRFYNQSAELAKALAKNAHLPLHLTALKRIKKTPPQVGKTAAERRKLPHNIFAVDSQIVQGKNILLIDDVWTTGSTANACAAQLKKAGAARVDVLTIAYVPPHGSDA